MPGTGALTSTITVGLVDDHQMLTDVLAATLASAPSISVVFKAYDCAGLRKALKDGCPRVLLLDVSLPDGDGLDMVAEIYDACPKTAVLVLTSMSDEATLMRALEAGVTGFVPKQRPLDELLASIRQAAAGEMVVPKNLLKALLRRTVSSGRRAVIKPETAPLLTARERQVLALIVEGMSGPEIAAALTIALPTVRTHVANLMAKLGVHSRLHAATFAIKHGLVGR
jgi:two-component system nitrate/nitrite response regulator NarL